MFARQFRLTVCSQGKAHDGIPADMIDIVWHSSLQGKDSRGWEPSTQLEGGWNPTFAIFVRHVSWGKRQYADHPQLKRKEDATLLPHATKYFIVSYAMMPVTPSLTRVGRAACHEFGWCGVAH